MTDEPRLTCPNDTDGDGNCGQRWCPVCGDRRNVVESTTPGDQPFGVLRVDRTLTAEEVEALKERFRLGQSGDIVVLEDAVFEPLNVGDETFEALLDWLRLERDRYQTSKWDYAEQDLEHARQGLGEESHFWQRGVENYTHRVRLASQALDGEWWKAPHAVQAVMKLAATVLSIPEHLLRAGLLNLDDFPAPGHTSGEVVPWKDER